MEALTQSHSGEVRIMAADVPDPRRSVNPGCEPGFGLDTALNWSQMLILCHRPLLELTCFSRSREADGYWTPPGERRAFWVFNMYTDAAIFLSRFEKSPIAERQ